MKVEVVQATSSHYYHVVPSELERVTLSPEQSAIFEYLSRIGSDRFVDFVTDVLVHVEGHKLLDKPDGPGDEKAGHSDPRPRWSSPSHAMQAYDALRRQKQWR